MKTQIKVYVSNSDAIASGYPESGEIAADVPADLTTEQRLELAAAVRFGSLTLSDVAALQQGLPAAIKAEIDARLMKRAKESGKLREAIEKGIAALLQKTPEEMAIEGWEYAAYRAAGYNREAADVVAQDPRIADRLAAAKVIAVARAAKNAEEKRVQEEQAAVNRAKAEAEKAESAKRRKAQIDTWVSEHGTVNQQGRYRLGLLPEQEIFDGMRAQAYAGLDAFPRYEKIRHDDLAHEDECGMYGDTPNLDCDVGPASGISDEQYAAYTIIREAAPKGAEFSILTHACRCEGCEAKLSRDSVKVAVRVGEMSFTREYAL